MNTIAHLIAIIVFIWASVYCFGTLGEDALGYVFIGLFLLFIPLTIAAAVEDWYLVKGSRHTGRGED